ncbi:MAG TPA: rod shape-determining protein RodA [Chitinophagales bacterium]|nr:rod shape-determining protein RodA [Chitinophagales bacterium]HMX04841.1 rod shape-determining protein RodA [Chitinophagales bacterium]HMZ88761.1 rod shape-determining protein RodA [Chitinophagales bacterium]HNE45502.1 rod shape-determining protein RodA [Chitinophagales bacterium]HNI52916.1 rod shape-determining protein RodA [Chitinophagales bacterium]
MREKKSIMENVDQPLLWLYLSLMVIGLLNVFAVSFSDDVKFFDLSLPHGKQFLWMGISLVVGFSILTFESSFFTKFAMVLYGVTIAVLIVTFVVAVDINGARSWLQVGSFQFQPAEFGKTTTALMLAKFLSIINGQPRSFKNKLLSYLIIGVPMGIIVLQSDVGSALVYASLVLVVYREGFPVYEVLFVLAIGLCFVFALIFGVDPVAVVLTFIIWLYIVFNSFKLVRKEKIKGIVFLVIFSAGVFFFLIGGEVLGMDTHIAAAVMLIAMIAALINVRKVRFFQMNIPVVLFAILMVFVMFGVETITTDILEDYQVQRIETLLGMSDDADAEYNVTQSKMTIGSGGVFGKGYLQGTLTQSEQVPEQSTDFIFCTIGEEWGFFGTFIFLVIYLLFILRVIFIAERQRSPFSRVYAYCVASFFFLQIMINVGMTIGLIPVIGIPLPFISYGGSSVLAFSIMIFIMLRLDADRLFILR